jgi:hypothetical protein
MMLFARVVIKIINFDNLNLTKSYSMKLIA